MRGASGKRFPKDSESGVAPGEKMKNTIDIGGIAYIAEIKFEVEIVLNALGFNREGLTIGQVIDNGLY